MTWLITERASFAYSILRSEALRSGLAFQSKTTTTTTLPLTTTTTTKKKKSWAFYFILIKYYTRDNNHCVVHTIKDFDNGHMQATPMKVYMDLLVV